LSFWAYMLRCADGTYYVGQTEDLAVRLYQHQSGAIDGYTSKRRPVELVWSEVFAERAQAKEAERIVKGWSRVKKEALIEGNADRLHFFSAPPAERKSRFPERRRGASPSEAEAHPATEPFSASLEQPPRLRSGKRLLDERGARSSVAKTLSSSTTPVIVLVRPQLGENIGKAARAMLNFGLTEMRLVSPRDGWPNPQAGPAAAGADMVIANAQVFDSVEAATADCTHVYATTVRKRGVTKPVVTPEEATATIRAENSRAAILFGPERAGLETDDVALARTIITVPINPEFGSLNLAQAVLVVAYEWSKGEALAIPPRTEAEPPAPQAELDGLWVHLDTMLTDAGFYFPPDKVPTIRRAIRTILTKPGWNQLEVRTMRGVLTAIEKPRRRDS
jgi:tRNA/rRNA methyltransferase